MIKPAEVDGVLRNGQVPVSQTCVADVSARCHELSTLHKLQYECECEILNGENMEVRDRSLL